MHPLTRVSGAAAAALIGISLAACGSSGSSGKSAASTHASNSPTSSTTTSSSTPASAAASATPDAVTLIHEARAATAKAKSAHLSGSIVEDKKPMKLDAKGTMDGSNQELIVSQGKGTATVRTVDKLYYVKGDKAFWQANGGAAEASVLADRWIKTSDDPNGDFSGMTIGGLMNEAIGPQNLPDSELKSDATTRKTTYDGQPAFVVTQTSTGDTITISAATKYVLALKTGSHDDSSGNLTITGWDQQPRLTAPAGAIALPSGA